MRFGSPRGPGWGAIVLLVVLVAVLLSGGEEDTGPGDVRDRRSERERSREGGQSGERRSDDGQRPQAPPGVLAEVVDVVDGDTIEVAFGGEIEDVRYIGIDTPESVAPGQPVECFGKAASHYNERLVEGQTVRLVFDDERRDQYGRLLAYVYVGPRFVNAALVRAGYARTLTISPNTDRAALFDRLARRAGAAGRGLWETCAP